MLKETLQGGLLASVPGAPCAGVVIWVLVGGGRWFRGGDQGQLEMVSYSD